MEARHARAQEKRRGEKSFVVSHFNAKAESTGGKD